MSSQVGGISDDKNRILSIEPNLLLKPLQNHHRGLREVVFYEIMKFDLGKSQHEFCKFNLSLIK